MISLPYINEKTETAKMLHGCLLDISLEIKRICEKYNIGYFLIAGSLLGCIRHGGIIPWDDDMDIGMLREDYELFLEKCEIELHDPFKLVNFEKEKNFGLAFSKIKIEGTVFEEMFSPDDLDKGIFVDIFPIDRMPDKQISRKIQNIMLKILRKLMRLKCGYSGYKFDRDNEFITKCLQFLSRMMSKNTIANNIYYWETKYNNHATKYFTNFSGIYPYGRELYPDSVMKKRFVYRQFDGCEFTVPEDADKILTLLYGDYMKLPPENEQIFKHTNNISFGNYVPHSVCKH